MPEVTGSISRKVQGVIGVIDEAECCAAHPGHDVLVRDRSEGRQHHDEYHMGASLFCDPLAGLDPNDAANEHTVVWTGLTLGGTTTSTFGTSGGKYTTRYLGGLAAVPRVARAPLGSWINSLVVTVTK